MSEKCNVAESDAEKEPKLDYDAISANRLY